MKPDHGRETRVIIGDTTAVITRMDTIGSITHTITGDTLIMGITATHTGITPTLVVLESVLVFNSTNPKLAKESPMLRACTGTSEILDAGHLFSSDPPQDEIDRFEEYERQMEQEREQWLDR
ncbi:MAG TPA: hypothetical protein VFO40_10910 [Chthoniobacterales bacterium]|nr:hypothetical protein [Chthoniobacterales bacterium]